MSYLDYEGTFRLAAERWTLHTLIPQWDDQELFEVERLIMWDWLGKKGYSEAEIAEMCDARGLAIAYTAMLTEAGYRP